MTLNDLTKETVHLYYIHDLNKKYLNLNANRNCNKWTTGQRARDSKAMGSCIPKGRTLFNKMSAYYKTTLFIEATNKKKLEKFEVGSIGESSKYREHLA